MFIHSIPSHHSKPPLSWLCVKTDTILTPTTDLSENEIITLPFYFLITSGCSFKYISLNGRLRT